MKKLGKFEILEQIGKGAMAIVYKARDPFIGRLVALKIITTALAEDPALLERFYQEARSAGALEHPNIVTIFELGKEGDTPFIAMAFLEGGSLDKLIEARPVLSLSEKLSYIVYVCRALEYAHKRGVIHRDIKPGNVMVTADGTVKVVDFGIARFGDTGRTQTGTLIGTLAYMSPQLLGGETADARSDIWAVGVMFYELLAYQRPFNGENHVALMMNIHSQPTPSILEAAPGTPPDVVEIVERMLRKAVDERFQSMDEVLIELEPVWKRLQQAEVSVLVAESKQLFEARDLGRAQEVLRKALLIDTANTQARNLLEKINADIRRMEIIPRARGRVEKGENFLAAGQFEDAKAEAEAALHLDSNYLPARELLAQVQIAVERARVLAQGLRATKQRLAEGAITQAELQLTKVLEIDSANVAAQDLLKQIREEKSRREYQKRLSEALQRARASWTELRYDECIQLLLEAQRKFPGEGEIDNLLETARQEKAEQERQALLTQARSFLRTQQFDEALKVLERVLAQSPADSTANNLLRLILQGREQQLHERQLREDLATLRALVKDGKYQEAIARGEELLREFPKEFELGELVAYARNENIQREQKRKLEQWIEKVNQGIKSSRFKEAIQAAKSGLDEFPRDSDLMLLLERAKKQQEEKEKRELEERSRREYQQRLSETLQHAKAHWTEHRYEECIQLLLEAQRKFPGEGEIDKLLETARQEKAEQERQALLTQARNFLRTQQFDEALKVVERVLAASPADSTGENLRMLALQGREQQLHERRLREDLARLRALVKDEKYHEAVARGEELLREFPKEFELGELVAYARNENIQREQKRKLEQWIEKVNQGIKSSRFKEAIQAAKSGLDEFPRDSDLMLLLERAKKQQEEKEKRELEERSRREYQQRLSETLQHAKAHWTEHRYEECIQLLLEAQRKFPGEGEIDKLLETARQEKAEQERQALLTQARNFLRTQQFDEALKVVERVLAATPADSTAKNLRMLVLQGREQQLRERRLREDLARLRALVKDEKYHEAVARGEELLREFPKEFELGELVAYARNENIQHEQKRKLEQWIEKVNQGIKSSRFKEAIQAAKSGLDEFPRDSDLMLLLERAKKQQEEKEKREVLEQRIKEVRTRINREELTGAIELAKQTLVNFGPDTDITQLLHQAEVEFEQRESKKREQQEIVQAARTMADAGNLGDATMMLQRAVETRIFTDSDPLLGEVLREIDAKKPAPPSPVPSSAPMTPGPRVAPWTTPTGDPGKDYVYHQRGGAPPDVSVTSHQDTAPPTVSQSATTIGLPSTQPSPQPALPEEKKARGKPGKLKHQQQLPGPSSRGTAAGTSPASLKVPPLPPPVRPLHGEANAELLADAVTQLPPTALPLWKRPRVIGGIAAVLALTISLTAYLIHQPKQPPTTYEPAIAAVRGFVAQFRWDDADKALSGLPKSLQEYSQLKAQIAAGRSDDNDFNSRESKIGPAEKAKNEKELRILLDYFNRVVGQRGRHSIEAQDVVARINRDLVVTPPPPPNYKSTIAAVRNFINQSRWNDAEGELNGLPTSLPEYSQLKAEIAAGRSEDNEFNSQKTAVVRAENPKNEKELHTLLDYFNGVLGQRGRHSVEAQDFVARIRRDLVVIPPPQSNYEPVIAAARGSINQARWDDAEKSLSGLPASLPEYSQLKSQIEAGRHEDNDFTSRKADYARMKVDKNENALHNLRDFFNGVANEGGRHSNEARAIISGIDKDVADIIASRAIPPKPSPPPTGSSSVPVSTGSDAAAIQTVLNKYAQALTDGNLDEAKAVRQLRGDQEKKLADSFKATKGNRYALQGCTAPEIKGDEAKVSCEMELVGNRDTRPQHLNFSLNKTAGQWFIIGFK